MNKTVGSARAPANWESADVREVKRSLRPPWWLIATLILLIGTYLVAAATGAEAVRDSVNLLGPAALGLVAVVAGIHLLLRIPVAIWTPYAWFLLAIVAFYSIGPLLYPLGGAGAQQLASSLYSVTPNELLRTNLLNAVGIVCVLLGYRMVVSIRGRSAQESLDCHGGAGKLRLRGPSTGPSTAGKAVRISPKAVALVFLILGGIVQYLVILPVWFGETDMVVPGMLWNLGSLHLLGIALLAYVVAGGEHSWRVPLWALWAVQLLVSFLLFSKHKLILALVLPPVGAFAQHKRMSRLALWGLLALAVYVSIPQLVLHGRAQVQERSGTNGNAALSERAEIVAEWFANGMPSLNERVSPVTSGWARLNYAPVQAFAMRRYNNGYPGNSVRYTAVVLIPRFIWPDKPVTTDLAVDYYELMTGRRSSHLGLGIFGEGYWNFGWAGVIVLGLVTGVVFGLVGACSTQWMLQRSFVYLPSVLLGIEMGALGTTATFANAVIGGGALIGVYSLGAWAIVSLVKGRNNTTGRWVGRLPTSKDNVAS